MTFKVAQDRRSQKYYNALEPDSKKLHIILDLETLAVNPKAAVTEIAAQALRNDEWFSVLIDPTYYPSNAFVTDKETVAWHDKRNPQYPSYVSKLATSGTTPECATFNLVDWICSMEQKYGAHAVIWTRGIDFDIPILTNLLSFYGIKNPWHYRNVRDIRTLGAIVPGVKVIAGDHTALGDVRAAAAYMSQLAFVEPRIATMLGFDQEGS